MKYFLACDAGTAGTNTTDLFEADTEEEADLIAYEMALEWARSYYDVISDDEADAYDEDEHYSSFIFEYEVGYSYEKYDPEKHDEELY